MAGEGFGKERGDRAKEPQPKKTLGERVVGGIQGIGKAISSVVSVVVGAVAKAFGARSQEPERQPLLERTAQRTSRRDPERAKARYRAETPEQTLRRVYIRVFGYNKAFESDQVIAQNWGSKDAMLRGIMNQMKPEEVSKVFKMVSLPKKQCDELFRRAGLIKDKPDVVLDSRKSLVLEAFERFAPLQYKEIGALRSLHLLKGCFTEQQMESVLRNKTEREGLNVHQLKNDLDTLYPMSERRVSRAAGEAGIDVKIAKAAAKTVDREQGVAGIGHRAQRQRTLNPNGKGFG